MRVYACICVYMRVYACICMRMRVYACICVHMAKMIGGQDRRPEFEVLEIGYSSSIEYPAYADMPPSGAGGVKTTQLATLSSGMQK